MSRCGGHVRLFFSARPSTREERVNSFSWSWRGISPWGRFPERTSPWSCGARGFVPSRSFPVLGRPWGVSNTDMPTEVNLAPSETRAAGVVARSWPGLPGGAAVPYQGAGLRRGSAWCLREGAAGGNQRAQKVLGGHSARSDDDVFAVLKKVSTQGPGSPPRLGHCGGKGAASCGAASQQEMQSGSSLGLRALGGVVCCSMHFAVGGAGASRDGTCQTSLPRRAARRTRTRFTHRSDAPCPVCSRTRVVSRGFHAPSPECPSAPLPGCLAERVRTKGEASPGLGRTRGANGGSGPLQQWSSALYLPPCARSSFRVLFACGCLRTRPAWL